MLPADIERQLEASEYLALDNVLLARRAAEAERQLERERASREGATSIMGAMFLGWSSAREQSEEDTAVELRARADENLQLQHALLEQQREAQSALHTQAVRGGAYLSLLRRELDEVEAQLAAGRAELKRATDEHTRGQQESKQSLEALHGVCRELRSKCASTLDELEASGQTVAKLKQRDAEHQQWKAKVKEAWAAEQAERQEEVKRLEQQLADRLKAEPLRPAPRSWGGPEETC